MLYAGFRYGWTSADVGLALAVVGIANIIVQAGLIGRIVAALGEWAAMIFGLICGALGFLAYGLAPTGAWFVAAIPVFSLMGVFGAALSAAMSRIVDPGDQGKLQGANSSLMGLTGLVGPGLFTQALAWGMAPTIGLPGASFLLASGILATCAACVALGVNRAPAAQGS